jgi:acetyl-CoA hydrolase
LIKTPAQVAKVVIAEVNERMPRTLGDSFIHFSKIDYAVPVDYSLAELAMGDTTELSMKIGAHIADLIEDGSTMQMGIGAIPDSVLNFLGDKKDLGVHTELFSDGVMDLVQTGVINNEKKTLHTGKIVAGFIIGTNRLYDFVDDNPIVELHPTEYVNDPFVIAQNSKMISINSAIEVDLTGQVCADSIGPRLYSGVGGQLDFVYGASRSKGGKPIIALPSTATMKDGTVISRIVTMLKPGAGVVTTRNHVHYVATEYGVAHLYGKSIRQRARALIDIAHPDFQEQLEKEAAELRYL